uniref:Laminin N-terminal domain-containing protein n=1 Tax=Heterorhabditis bacteriophora TaxID=37862 RepID=A0A1I7X4M1_HETBA
MQQMTCMHRSISISSTQQLLESGKLYQQSGSSPQFFGIIRLPTTLSASTIRSREFAVWRAAVFLLATVACQARERERQSYTQEDPSSQFLCRGSLGEYAACQCNENEGEISCINAQFVDTDAFLNVNNYYK